MASCKPARNSHCKQHLQHHNLRPTAPQCVNISSITYPIKSIFNTTTDDRWVSFEELGESSRSMWELVMYPNIYRTYPQDVPIRDIVKAIKSGSLVSAVS
eukprot:TsM_001181700 transcript=TsM_001181700 gene=TsM_001181700